MGRPSRHPTRATTDRRWRTRNLSPRLIGISGSKPSRCEGSSAGQRLRRVLARPRPAHHAATRGRRLAIGGSPDQRGCSPVARSTAASSRWLGSGPPPALDDRPRGSAAVRRFSPVIRRCSRISASARARGAAPRHRAGFRTASCHRFRGRGRRRRQGPERRPLPGASRGQQVRPSRDVQRLPRTSTAAWPGSRTRSPPPTPSAAQAIATSPVHRRRPCAYTHFTGGSSRASVRDPHPPACSLPAGARPGTHALHHSQPPGNSDLLGFRGQICSGRIPQATSGFPTRPGELQTSVVPIPRVGTPVATGLAPGDRVPVDAGFR